MSLLIPIGAVSKPRMTRQDKWHQRKCVTLYWEYKRALQAYAIILPDVCKVTFYVSMPATWSKK
jgi:hypothetical protein